MALDDQGKLKSDEKFIFGPVRFFYLITEDQRERVLTFLAKGINNRCVSVCVWFYRRRNIIVLTCCVTTHWDLLHITICVWCVHS